MVFTVSFASWWMIFGLSQARQLGALEGRRGAGRRHVRQRMLVWEGTVLIGMLVAGGVGASRRPSAANNAAAAMSRKFFMAFTHDLKTSLTSLRLQAEGLREDMPDAAANPNLQRLLKDSVPPAAAARECARADHRRRRVFIEPVAAQIARRLPARGFARAGHRPRRRRAACAPTTRARERDAQPAAERVVHGRASRVALDVRRLDLARV